MRWLGLQVGRVVVAMLLEPRMWGLICSHRPRLNATGK